MNVARDTFSKAFVTLSLVPQLWLLASLSPQGRVVDGSRVHTRIDNIKHGFIQAFSFIFFFLDWHIFTSYLNLKLVLQRGSEWAGTGNRPANVFNLCFWNLLLESPLTLQVKFVVSYQNYFNPQLKNKITSFQSQIWSPGEREFTSSRVVCSCCRGRNPAVAGMVGAATRWVV